VDRLRYFPLRAMQRTRCQKKPFKRALDSQTLSPDCRRLCGKSSRLVGAEIIAALIIYAIKEGRDKSRPYDTYLAHIPFFRMD